MQKLPNNHRPQTVRTTTVRCTPTFVVSVLVGILLCLAVLYMYFLSMSVMHVVLRKEVHQSASQVRTEIAELEAAYIVAQHAVSERIANAEVLTETSDKIFIERTTPTLVLGTTAN